MRLSARESPPATAVHTAKAPNGVDAGMVGTEMLYFLVARATSTAP